MIDLKKKYDGIFEDCIDVPKINIFDQSPNDRLEKIISGIENEILKNPDFFSEKLKKNLRELKKEIHPLKQAQLIMKEKNWNLSGVGYAFNFN